MIPYFGRHGCKQFLLLKPVRFGFKAWVMAQKDAYCLQVDLYQGKCAETVRDSNVGLGESVVLTFCGSLMKSYPGTVFSFYFDNFFTNEKLICGLGRRGMKGTGMVRSNRLAKCPMPDKKTMKKWNRGDYVSYVVSEQDMVAVGGNDNNAVFVLSNESGVSPLQQAIRYSVAKKCKITVPQPNVINNYNKCMGGVDLMDKNISNYRIAVRGKKWYVPIVFWLLDVCMNNAWLLGRAHGVSVDNLAFRRACAQALLQKYGTPPKLPGPMRYAEKIGRPARETHGSHLIITGQPKRRCAQ